MQSVNQHVATWLQKSEFRKFPGCSVNVHKLKVAEKKTCKKNTRHMAN